MIQTPCIIFAGGKSSRMGEDKALLPFGSYSSLAHYQYERLSKIFQRVYISTKESGKFNFNANFITDIPSQQETYAPTAGFIAMYEKLDGEKFFVLSVDAPFVDTAVINKLFEADKNSVDATIAKTRRGIQPMCGIYHRTLQNQFNKMAEQNNHKLGLMLKNSNSRYVFFENEKTFLNLNHPHEYQEALQLL